MELYNSTVLVAAASGMEKWINYGVKFSPNLLLPTHFDSRGDRTRDLSLQHLGVRSFQLTVVGAPSTAIKDPLHLGIIPNHRESDSFELAQMKAVFARGHMDMAAAS